MTLEIGKKYLSKNNTCIIVNSVIPENDFLYSSCSKVTGYIVSGLIDNLIIPSGYRDANTGDCLSINAGGLKGQKLHQQLDELSINISNHI